MITGGPGTGKTTVAGKVIAIMARASKRLGAGLPALFIAAPTGKAAQRLRESFLQTGQDLVRDGFLSHDDLAMLTQQVSTLHRLPFNRGAIGTNINHRRSVNGRRSDSSPSLAHRTASLSDHALLGDPQQLASVDAGRSVDQ